MIMNKNPIRLRESTVKIKIKIKALNKKKSTKQIILTCKRATCKIESYTFLE